VCVAAVLLTAFPGKRAGCAIRQQQVICLFQHTQILLLRLCTSCFIFQSSESRFSSQTHVHWRMRACSCTASYLHMQYHICICTHLCTRTSFTLSPDKFWFDLLVLNHVSTVTMCLNVGPLEGWTRLAFQKTQSMKIGVRTLQNFQQDKPTV